MCVCVFLSFFLSLPFKALLSLSPMHMNNNLFLFLFACKTKQKNSPNSKMMPSRKTPNNTNKNSHSQKDLNPFSLTLEPNLSMNQNKNFIKSHHIASSSSFSSSSSSSSSSPSFLPLPPRPHHPPSSSSSSKQEQKQLSTLCDNHPHFITTQDQNQVPPKYYKNYMVQNSLPLKQKKKLEARYINMLPKTNK